MKLTLKLKSELEVLRRIISWLLTLVKLERSRR
jgi:hypothetical protein